MPSKKKTNIKHIKNKTYTRIPVNASTPSTEGFNPDYLVIGDLHLKTSMIEPMVLGAIARNPNIREAIFLGDLNDDWAATQDKRVNEMKGMFALTRKLRKKGVMPTVLIGNHDVTYLNGVDSTSLLFRNTSPGHDYNAEPEITETMSRMGNLKAATVITVLDEPVLLTHAGVTQGWLDWTMPGDSERTAGMVCKHINKLMRNGNWDVLYSIGSGRGGWGVPSPLWADESELLYDPAIGLNQIVGHTPVPELCTVNETGYYDDDHNESACRFDVSLTFCDTMSTYQDHSCIGDNSLLLIDSSSGVYMGMMPDGEMKPVITRKLEQQL